QAALKPFSCPSRRVPTRIGSGTYANSFAGDFAANAGTYTGTNYPGTVNFGNKITINDDVGSVVTGFFPTGATAPLLPRVRTTDLKNGASLSVIVAEKYVPVNLTDGTAAGDSNPLFSAPPANANQYPVPANWYMRAVAADMSGPYQDRSTTTFAFPDNG